MLSPRNYMVRFGSNLRCNLNVFLFSSKKRIGKRKDKENVVLNHKGNFLSDMFTQNYVTIKLLSFFSGFREFALK